MWERTIERISAIWLRFYNPEDQLVLLPEEAAEQYATETQRRAEETEVLLAKYREHFGNLTE